MIQKTLVLSLALLAAPLANAATSHSSTSGNWEISAGPGVAVNFFSSNGSSATIINLNGGVSGEVAYLIQPQLEVVANPALAYVSSGGTSLTTYALQAGLNYSFMPEVRDSVYFEALAGFLSTPGTTTRSTDFQYTLDLGKRFAITDSVSYRPSIQWQSVSTTPSQHSFNIVPVYFSFFL